MWRQPPQGCKTLLQVYCLPDGYEVVERSLDDIRYVLNPTFTAQEIARLDQAILLNLYWACVSSASPWCRNADHPCNSSPLV